MPTIIAIANQKGGVGKTTTAVTLGHGLAREGRKTLLIDLDSQGHVAMALGHPPGAGLYRLLVQGHELKRVAIPAREDVPLWIVPSDKNTAVAKQVISARRFSETALDRALSKDSQWADVVIIDCPPSLDVLHTAALVASDWLLVPVKLDHLALAGVLEMQASLAEVQEAGYGCRMLAIVPTFYDRVTTETQVQLENLIERFGELVWPPIPVDTKLREAPAYGKSILEYAPNSRAVIGVLVKGGSDEEQRVGGYADLIRRVAKILV